MTDILDPAAGVDEFDDPAPPKRGVVTYDRWNRYVLPHPVTGKTQSWTRVTTLAKALEDTYNLNQWEQRTVVQGMAWRPDLVRLAASTDPSDKKALQDIAVRAKESARSSIGSNNGTALHNYVERMDDGQHTAWWVQLGMSPETRADLDAYQATMDRFQLVPLPQFTERVLCNLELNVCGRVDRIVIDTIPNTVHIADLKTQQGMTFNLLAIAIQLATYANSDYMWNEDTGEWEPMPPLDLVTAVVMHLPVDQEECEIYDVDIAAGWEYAKLAHHIREVRKTSKTLVTARKSNNPAIYRRAILNATTRDDLSAVWREAQSRNEWTPELQALGDTRLREITAP